MSQDPSTTPAPSSSRPSPGWKENLRHDAPAGLVVFFVAVPLCLGIALASGAPLFSGLIAGMVGGIVVGAISRSPLGVSGPAAGLAVIVLNAIEDLGSFQTFLLAVVLTGVIQIGLGLARAGILAYFFPSAVIKGMLAGIGILIVLKQIPHAAGHDSDPEGDQEFLQPDGENTITSLMAVVDDLEPSAIVISCVGLVLLILWEKVLSKKGKVFQWIQGPLAVVGFGIAYQAFTSKFAPGWSLEESHLVTVPVAGSLSEIGSLFTAPDWSQLSNTAIYVTAITMAVVASLETLLCVEATDRLDPQKRVTPTNRELVAQGTGNVLSGLIGGLPITQVIVRSSANVQSGGRTKMSAIIHGVLLAVAVLMLPQVLNMVPLAVLAAILLVVGYKLAKPALFAQMWRLGQAQFMPFIITIVGIVFTDLLKGIAMGMVAALFVILLRNYQNSHSLHIERSLAEDGTARVRLRFSEELSFLNKGAILRELSSIPDGAEVVLDTSQCVAINQDVLEVIEDFTTSGERRGLRIQTVGTVAARPQG